MNNSQISQANSKKMRGQALLEFALVAPVLMLIIFGIIEFGRMFFIYSQVNNAAREAAHYGITTELNGATEHYLDCTGIEQVAQSFSFLSPVTVVTAYDDGAVHQAYCGDSSYSHTLGDRIVITTTADFETLVPLVNIPPITFSASVARTILKGLPFDESLPSAPIGCYNLALDPSPYVGGTVIVIDPGTACPADDRFYDDGAVVTYLAVPNSSYSFIEWIDDGAGTNITGTVTMTEDKSVVGIFESPLECHFLNKSITPSGAAGSIIAVTDYNCEENFRDGWLDGTLVRINAIPSSGYSFVDWSGDMNGTANPQDLLFINGDQDVTGNFVADACYTIAVNRIPVVGGDHTYSPPKDCPDGSGWLDGTVVTLDAIVNSGYTFGSWDDGTTPPITTTTTITMTMNMTTPASIDLTFDSILPCYTLSVSPSPNTGGGAVASPEQNCVGGWTEGTELDLYAIPNPGYSFGSWNGAVTNTTATPTGIVMNAPRNVIVYFDYTGNDLAIIKSGTVLVQEGGTITYTLRVVNNGSNPATSIIVNDTLPATVSYAGYSSSLGSCAPSGGNVVCFLGTLPAGPSSTEIEIYATAITAGTAVNSALVYAAESDPNPGNNTDSTTTVIKLPIDLEIIKSGPTTSVQGEELTYTLVVTNHGPGIATNVIVNDMLPADTQHVSTSSPLCTIDSSQDIRCFLGTMNSGDSFTTDIVLIPLGSSSGGGTTVITPTLTNDAYIDEVNPNNVNSTPLNVYHKDGKSHDNISLIQFDLSSVSGTIDSAELILNASSIPSPAQPDNITVGNINASWNEGSVTFNNYGGDTLSVTGGTQSGSEVSFNVATMVNNWVNNGVNNYGFAIESIHSGKLWVFDSKETGTAPQLIITTSAPAGSSTLINEATVAASESETDTGNNSDDATTTITTGVEFIIAKGAANDRACGEAGDSVIVYGYNWVNAANNLDISFEHGEVPATNVSMLAIANYTPSGSPWQETVTLPAIAVDDYHTIRVTHGGVNVLTRFQIPCPAPDLIVSDPVLIGTQPITSHTPISFTVVVTNIGNLAAISEFPVGLYIDPSPAPIVGDTYITETARVLLSLIGGLEPSNSHTLTMAIDAGLAITGTYDAYAVADSDPSPTGQIAERNETNNLSSAVSLTVVENPDSPDPTPTPSPPTISGTISGLAYIIDAGFNVQQYTQVELYDITGGDNVLMDTAETDGGGFFTFSNVQAGGTILYKVTGCIIKDSQPYFYSIQPIILATDGSSYFVNMELQPVGSCG